MTDSTHTVLICGRVDVDDDCHAALVTAERHTIVVPRVRTANGPVTSGLGPAATPWRVWRSARRGEPPTGGTAWVVAPAISVPTVLLNAVGGVDPRYSTQLAWADLVTRLRVIEPSLTIREIDDVIESEPRRDPDAWARDARAHSVGRSGIGWRVVARLIRSRARDSPGGSLLLDPEIRDARPRG